MTARVLIRRAELRRRVSYSGAHICRAADGLICVFRISRPRSVIDAPFEDRSADPYVVWNRLPERGAFRPEGGQVNGLKIVPDLGPGRHPEDGDFGGPNRPLFDPEGRTGRRVFHHPERFGIAHWAKSVFQIVDSPSSTRAAPRGIVPVLIHLNSAGNTAENSCIFAPRMVFLDNRDTHFQIIRRRGASFPMHWTDYHVNTRS